MKLFLACVLTLVAATWADQGYYQPQPVAQTAPSAYSTYNNNYYDNQQTQKQGWLDRLFGSNRRQGIAGLLGGLGAIGPIGAIVAVVVVVVVVVAVAAVATQLSSSGRGLESDKWEVDHSVWMDQLQKDFEDSWSEE